MNKILKILIGVASIIIILAGIKAASDIVKDTLDTSTQAHNHTQTWVARQFAGRGVVDNSSLNLVLDGLFFR